MDDEVQGVWGLLFSLESVANKLAELNVGHTPERICKMLKAIG